MIIQDQLVSKLRKEYNAFLSNLESLAPKEVIEKAQEIVTKEAILNYFAHEYNGEVDDEVVEMLLNINHTLEDFYTSWKHSENVSGDSVFANVAQQILKLSFDYEPTVDDEWLTYKAEIHDPTEPKDPTLVVFMASSDEDALKQAYEHCLEIEDATLLEVHELDYDYDSIRELEVPLNEIMPDLSITSAERNDYGFTDETILPLNAERAAALFEQNQKIYLLWNDNTKDAVNDTSQIAQHRGVFGIDKTDWLDTKEFKDTQRLLLRIDAVQNKLVEPSVDNMLSIVNFAYKSKVDESYIKPYVDPGFSYRALDERKAAIKSNETKNNTKIQHTKEKKKQQRNGDER